MPPQFITNPKGGENLSVQDFFSRAQALHDYFQKRPLYLIEKLRLDFEISNILLF